MCIRDRRLPGLRDLGRQRTAARLPRGPGLRVRRDRLGGDGRGGDAQAIRAKKRVVTYGKAVPPSRGAASGPAPNTRRTPTVRTIRSAIVEPKPAPPPRPASPAAGRIGPPAAGCLLYTS